MPIVDRSKVAKSEGGMREMGDVVRVPGVYVVEVKSATSKLREKDGCEEWLLLCEIKDGEQKGKIWFENLYWTERATDRCLNILSALGVNVPASGPVDYRPEELVGKSAIVELVPSGNEKYPIKSSYDGWKPVASDYPF